MATVVPRGKGKLKIGAKQVSKITQSRLLLPYCIRGGNNRRELARKRRRERRREPGPCGRTPLTSRVVWMTFSTEEK